MSNKSNNQGRAYEYIWINTLHDMLTLNRKVVIVKNSSYEANYKAWNSLNQQMQELLKISAKSAVNTLLELEPLMLEDDKKELTLEFQTDDNGKKGDVRDILIRRENISWEIGLSIKHNHEAVKHSRLSHVLDFGKEWFDIPCSKEYWDAIKPIFDDLKQKQSLGILWKQVKDKDDKIYVPLLNAFIEEIKSAYDKNHSISRKMIEYLIGIYDYHKVVSCDSKKLTMIETFNIHNTLNKPSRVRKSKIEVPTVVLPTELVAIKFKQNKTNTVEMYLNNGWQLSFRIHNASSRVEPSLKFDIQFIGTPTSILTIECKW